MDEQLLDEFFSDPDSIIRASKSQRLVNYIIDNIILGIIMLWTMVVMGLLIEHFEARNDSLTLTAGQDWIIGIIFMMGISSYILYYIIGEHYFKGRTLGKMVTKTKVVDASGRRPTIGQIIGRTFIRYVIPFEILSFLGASEDGWHDSLSGTIVVKMEK